MNDMNDRSDKSDMSELIFFQALIEAFTLLDVSKKGKSHTHTYTHPYTHTYTHTYTHYTHTGSISFESWRALLIHMNSSLNETQIKLFLRDFISIINVCNLLFVRKK